MQQTIIVSIIAMHSHGDIVAHVSGDVDAQVFFLSRQVKGDVVHIPGGGVVDQHLDEDHDFYLSCSASSLSSRLSRALRLDSQWMMKPE